MSSSYKNIPGNGSATWKDPVNTSNDLPSSGNTIGDSRIVENPSSSIYTWNGSSWIQITSVGGGVSSLNTLIGGLTISAGTGINVATGTNTITITNTGSGGNTSTVNTTDATVTTLSTISTTTNTTFLIETKIVAQRTGGLSGSAGDGAYYILRGRVKNIGGTVTLLNVVSEESEDQVAWDANLVVNTTNILIQVTGAAGNNITWNSTTTTYSAP